MKPRRNPTPRRAYNDSRPDSGLSRLSLLEGLQSSMTSPLCIDGRPVAFIFIANENEETFRASHATDFQKIEPDLARLLQMSQSFDSSKEESCTQLGLGRVAHDLRSPLSVFKMTLDLIASQAWFKSLDNNKSKYFEILDRKYHFD